MEASVGGGRKSSHDGARLWKSGIMSLEFEMHKGLGWKKKMRMDLLMA